jgi:putative ABC transport system permease protein
LISGDFIRLAIIASAIALPVSWWLVTRWLEGFAYRIAPGFGTALLTETLILIVAIGTIATLTLKAAAANPIRSLRTE